MTTHLLRKQEADPALDRYPEALAPLITHGEPTDDTDYAGWAEQLRGYVPDLIRMVLDDDLNSRKEDDPAVWAPVHALKVLGVLGPAEAAEPLLECFDWDDERITEELPEVYASIGPAAIPWLHNYLRDPSHDPLNRATASTALVAIAQRHPPARDTIVTLLTAFLDRPEADDSSEEEDVTSYVIADLGELGARSAYEAIRRAFAENRVNPIFVGLEDIERDFGMRPPLDPSHPPETRTEPGVRLELRCKACGRVRPYLFPRVYVDVGTLENEEKRAKYSPLVIPQPVVCSKCGAVDQYELTDMTFAAITASILANRLEQEGRQDVLLRRDQRVRFVQLATRWGPMHPLEAIERYRREIARRPTDSLLYERLGNVLKFMGRLDEAEKEYRRGLALEPKNIGVRIGLAQVAMLRKDIPAAIHWWTEVKALLPTAHFEREGDRDLLMDQIEKDLADLRRGIVPDYEPLLEYYEEEKVMDTPSPPPTSQRRQSAVPKVGRNEPCPCGSGKKYKHCHGRPGA